MRGYTRSGEVSRDGDATGTRGVAGKGSGSGRFGVMSTTRSTALDELDWVTPGLLAPTPCVHFLNRVADRQNLTSYCTLVVDSATDVSSSIRRACVSGVLVVIYGTTHINGLVLDSSAMLHGHMSSTRVQNHFYSPVVCTDSGKSIVASFFTLYCWNDPRPRRGLSTSFGQRSPNQLSLSLYVRNGTRGCFRNARNVSWLMKWDM